MRLASTWSPGSSVPSLAAESKDKMKRFSQISLFLVAGVVGCDGPEDQPAVEQSVTHAEDHDSTHQSLSLEARYERLNDQKSAGYLSYVDEVQGYIRQHQEHRGAQVVGVVPLLRPDNAEVRKIELKLAKGGQDAGFLVLDLQDGSFNISMSASEGATLVEQEISRHTDAELASSVFEYGLALFAFENDAGELVASSSELPDQAAWQELRAAWSAPSKALLASLKKRVPNDGLGPDGTPNPGVPVPVPVPDKPGAGGSCTDYLPFNNSAVPNWRQFDTPRMRVCPIGCGPLAFGQFLAWAELNWGQDIQIFGAGMVHSKPKDSANLRNRIEKIADLLHTKCITKDAAFTNYFRNDFYLRVQDMITEVNHGSFNIKPYMSYKERDSLENLDGVRLSLMNEKVPSIVFGWGPHSETTIKKQHIYVIDGYRSCTNLPDRYRVNLGHGGAPFWVDARDFHGQLKASMQFRGFKPLNTHQQCIRDCSIAHRQCMDSGLGGADGLGMDDKPALIKECRQLQDECRDAC